MNLKEMFSAVENRDFPLEWPGNFVGNKWLETKSGPTSSSVNPNNNSKLIDFRLDDAAIRTALDQAFEAKSNIREIPLGQRIEVLDRFRQTVADFEKLAESILCLEAGKAKWEAQEDIKNALAYIDWIVENHDNFYSQLLSPAALGPTNAEYKLIPLGVAAGYLPFSTPLTSFVFYFCSTVLSGCPLVLFSSTHAVLSSILFGQIIAQVDAPKGLLNVVFGNFNSFKNALKDPRIAAVLYTGSIEHCEGIRKDSKTKKGRQLILQSGGKNAVIVHSSADLDHAVNCVTYGALKSAGQRCTTTSRVFVFQDLQDEFNERIVERFKKIKIGRTDLEGDDQPFMGPLYSRKSVEKFLRFQTMANRESDKTLLWGKAFETDGDGHFVRPGIHSINQFDNNNAYQYNVLFSPDVAIYPYSVLEDAIEQLNTADTAFAVSFIGDEPVLSKRRHMFLAPNLLINAPTVEMETTLPLAGRLQSGHHRFHGPAAALYLCYPQAVMNEKSSQNTVNTWPWPKY
jgi:acyl-CoA reductase-like NAD-dependent aldehyde dehydrogenase